MRCTMVLAIAMVGGCVGTSVRASAGVSRTAGETTFLATTVGGLDTRSYAASDDDHAALFHLGVQIGGNGEGDGIGGGMTVGASYFVGRIGVVGLFGWGALDGPGGRDHVSLRFQLGVEIEVQEASDWRIHELADPCAGAGRSFRPNVQDHYMIGVLPGLEYRSNTETPWSMQLLGTFRWVREPPC